MIPGNGSARGPTNKQAAVNRHKSGGLSTPTVDGLLFARSDADMFLFGCTRMLISVTQGYKLPRDRATSYQFRFTHCFFSVIRHANKRMGCGIHADACVSISSFSLDGENLLVLGWVCQFPSLCAKGFETPHSSKVGRFHFNTLRRIFAIQLVGVSPGRTTTRLASQRLKLVLSPCA